MTHSKSSLVQELESDPRWLIALSQRLLGGAEGAEDLAQDAAALALRKRGEIPSESREQARAWLATTVKNLAQNARRRRATERHTRRDVELARVEGREPASDDVLAKAEYRSRVAALVLQLPDAEREAILQRYYEGKKAAELQDALGAPSPAAVRQRLSRGVRALRTRLDAEEQAGDWRHAALLTVAATGSAQAPAKAMAVALALGLLFSGVAGAWWLASKDTRGETNRTEEVATLEPAGPKSSAAPSGPEPSTDFAGAARQALPTEETAVPGPSPSAPELRVQFVDAVSGQPVAGHPWLIIPTGKLDYGRSFGLAGTAANPKPLARGVTDEEGFARAPMPDQELVNLCTERTETYARGSWPVRVVDGESEPQVAALTVGATIHGRVVDDVGTPLEGVQVFSRSYLDERMDLGVTDADGRYSIPRCADFPRSFVLREDGEVESTRTLPTEVALDRPGVPAGDVAALRASGYLKVVVGEETAVDAPEVVIARLATLTGRVVNSDGKGVAGALVTKSTEGGFAASGSALGTSLPSLPWSDSEFVLGQGRCLTGADGTYQLQMAPPQQGRTEEWLAAYSPGGAVGILKVDGVGGGAFLSGLDFELNDAETVRLRLSLPGGNTVLRDVPPSAKLIWDCSGERDVVQPTRGSSLVMTFAATPAIATNPDGSWVVIPKAHQPHREATAGELAGTLFVEGFQPARFELAPGAMQAEVELAPLRSVALRLDLEGSGTQWLERATVVVTPEMPDPELTDKENMSRRTFDSPIRTKHYSWQNGEERTVNAFGDRPVFAYVELTGTSPRGTIALPAFGPIPLADAEGGAPYVLKAELGDWPAGVVPITVAARPDGSPLLNERRATTIAARVVSAADGSFLIGAGADVVEEGFYPGSSQREWKGELRPIKLELVAEVVTLRFEHAQHVPKVLGPLTLTAGDAIDLGEIRLEPLRKIPCQLVNSDGEPAEKGTVITRNDPEAGWAQMKTDAEGRFDLFVGSTGPTPLRIRSRGGSRDPSCTTSVELLPDGTGRVVLPDRRTVRVRVTGLEAPYCYGFESLVAVGEAATAGGEPPRANYIWPHLDGTDLIFLCNLPPGNWTFHPVRSAFITFPPEPLLVESTEPDSTGQRAVLEVTIRATLKQP